MSWLALEAGSRFIVELAWNAHPFSPASCVWIRGLATLPSYHFFFHPLPPSLLHRIPWTPAFFATYYITERVYSWTVIYYCITFCFILIAVATLKIQLLWYYRIGCLVCLLPLMFSVKRNIISSFFSYLYYILHLFEKYEFFVISDKFEKKLNVKQILKPGGSGARL